MVEAEEVRIHSPSLGHPVVVYGHGPDPDHPGRWHTWEVGRGLLTEGESAKATVPVSPPIPSYASVQVAVDGSIPAGLYDDFVVARLSVESSSHFASLGFRAQLHQA